MKKRDLYQSTVTAKAVASEYNVRKRMVPRLLIFNTRARQAEIVRPSSANGEPKTQEELMDDIRPHLQDNEIVVNEGGDKKYKKETLKLGGGGDEL